MYNEPAKIDLTHRVGSFFKGLVGWVGSWIVFFFFFFLVDRVGCKSWDLQIPLTRPDPLLKIYIIQFCYLLFLLLFLNKTKILTFSHIVYVCLVLCSWLFGYKVVLICGGVALMLNLIIIIIINPTHGSNPTWVVLGWTPVMSWVGLNFF